MSTLSPNQIATLIYMAGDFGPFLGTRDIQGPHGQVIQQTPQPGSAEYRKAVNWLDTAIAICLAESGGNTHAVNPSGAVGLWQIMASVHQKELHDAITYWSTQTGKVLNEFDGRVNTMAASHVYQNAGNSWTPWQTYTEPHSSPSSYTHYLGHGKAAYAFLTDSAHLKAQVASLSNELNQDKFTAGVAGLLGAQVSGSNIGKDLGNLIPSLPSWLQPIFDFAKKGALDIGAFLLGLALVGIGIWVIVNHTKAGKSVKKSAEKVAAVAVLK
jgi:hypothetical protein